MYSNNFATFKCIDDYAETIYKAKNNFCQKKNKIK